MVILNNDFFFDVIFVFAEPSSFHFSKLIEFLLQFNIFFLIILIYQILGKRIDFALFFIRIISFTFIMNRFHLGMSHWFSVLIIIIVIIIFRVTIIIMVNISRRMVLVSVRFCSSIISVEFSSIHWLLVFMFIRISLVVLVTRSPLVRHFMVLFVGSLNLVRIWMSFLWVLAHYYLIWNFSF